MINSCIVSQHLKDTVQQLALMCSYHQMNRYVLTVTTHTVASLRQQNVTKLYQMKC